MKRREGNAPWVRSVRGRVGCLPARASNGRRARTELACRGSRATHRLPYRRRRAMLSAGELAFYQVLVAAVRGRWTISVKPRLADVIWCPPSLWRAAAGARVSQKHLDFVLYDPETTEVVVAVELDDRSHERRARRERDAFVDEVLRACRVGLLRVRAAASYDTIELEQRIGALLSRLDAAPRIKERRHSRNGRG